MSHDCFHWFFVAIAVGDEQVSTIGRGLCVLLGISVEDTPRDVEYM